MQEIQIEEEKNVLENSEYVKGFVDTDHVCTMYRNRATRRG